MKDRYSEVASFVRSWSKDKPRGRVVEEIASYFIETKRLPDPYYFLLGDDGKLIDPLTYQPVENSIEKDSHLGQAEWMAFQKIQEWNIGRSQGLAFWISPPRPERSKYTKIIVSEIVSEENERTLFNRSLLLEIDADESLNLAESLSLKAGRSLIFDSPEALRSQPVFIDYGDFDWIDYLVMHTNEYGILKKIRSGEDLKAKRQELQSADIMYEEMFGRDSRTFGFDDERVRTAVRGALNRGSFGAYDTSCPPAASSPDASYQPTAFAAVYRNSQEVGRILHCTCPSCHQEVDAIISAGRIHCPKCRSSAPYEC